MKGIERLISLKRFNVDRMVTVYFNPGQKLKESRDTVTSKNSVVRVNQIKQVKSE